MGRWLRVLQLGRLIDNARPKLAPILDMVYRIGAGLTPVASYFLDVFISRSGASDHRSPSHCISLVGGIVAEQLHLRSCKVLSKSLQHHSWAAEIAPLSAKNKLNTQKLATTLS